MFIRKKQKKPDTCIESHNCGCVRFNRDSVVRYTIERDTSCIVLTLVFDDGRESALLWTGTTASYDYVKDYVENCMGMAKVANG